jgi:hypothetical protein
MRRGSRRRRIRRPSRKALQIAPAILVSLMAVAVVGCSTASEQSLLSQFFAASRLRDTTALRNIATVVFEPNTQGIITSFEIMDVVPHGNGGASRSKDVSISAPVKLPSGQTAQKRLIVTIQRDAGDWMVTASTPRS